MKNIARSTYPSFWRRFFAYLIDLILVWILYIIIDSCLQAFTFLEVENPLASNGLFHFVLGIYFSLFECSPLQATPGKRLLSLKVESFSGIKLTFWQSVYRQVCKISSGIAFGYGYFRILAPHIRYTFHDGLSKSRVTYRNY